MQKLTGSVGEGATNKIHDVALIEVMLRVARNPKTKKPYFGQDFDGKFTRQTKEAIEAFQLQYGLAPPAKAAPARQAARRRPRPRRPRTSWA